MLLSAAILTSDTTVCIMGCVPELGRLLAELYKENKVGRYRHYCENWQDGYPKWFYVYYSL